MLHDKLLIWRFNRGDKQALHSIYEKYKDDLLTLATALLYEKSAAEDTIHDVFVSFIRSAEKFQLTGSLKAFLATCVANNARNRNKAMQHHKSLDSDETEAVASPLITPDNSAIFGEQSRQLSWALAQLPFEQREAIILHLYSGMKFKAIAKSQAVSINTIQGRYRYGLDKLRSLLDRQVKK